MMLYDSGSPLVSQRIIDRNLHRHAGAQDGHEPKCARRELGEK